MSEKQQLRAVLTQISDLIAGLDDGKAPAKAKATGPTALQQDTPSCSIRYLPPRLTEKAAAFACRVNPRNAPLPGASAQLPNVPETLLTAVNVNRYWGPTQRTLTVSFMEPTPADLRARIVSHLNAWSLTCGISFAETSGVGDVRISLVEDGYWSYLGTDIKLIPPNQATMSLQGFSMFTPESEYLRVVRHEAGHTLGFPHEHMRQALVARIDPAKAYAYFLATQGWSPATVDQQVLTPLDEASLYATPADQTSIMCYQLPGSITYDGQPIVGGLDINPSDYAFAAWVYPKFSFAPAGAGAPVAAPNGHDHDHDDHDEHIVFADDWGAENDPRLPM